jgi:hypothetical protein
MDLHGPGRLKVIRVVMGGIQRVSLVDDIRRNIFVAEGDGS